MAEQLSEHALETTLRVTRVRLPHDMLPGIAYAKVVKALEPEAETVAEGVEALDEGGTPFLAVDEDAQLAKLTAADGGDDSELRHPGGSVPAPQEMAA
jgi:hypothetical protein